MIWRCDLVPQYLGLKDEIDAALQRVLLSGRYILGEEGRRFEEEFAAYLGVPYAVGVANGTDGLTLALQAVGVKAGDEVITTPFTAIPTVAAIVDAGALPVFVDVRPDTFLMDIEQVPNAVTPRTAAVLPVHIFGNPVDIPRLRHLTPSHIPIVEDAAQAHGSTIHGLKCGSMGDLGVFSFYPTKNLGAYGDGGAIVTHSAGYSLRLHLRRMYGMVDKDHFEIHGVNSRLDELQAAVLRCKLRYLDAQNDARRVIADRYKRELPASLFRHQVVTDGGVCNYHVYVARVASHRDRLMRYLEERDIQTNVYYALPLYRQRAFADRFEGICLSNVEQLCREVIALPMYPELEADTQNRIIATISEFRGA